jgi:hypothetical protein
MPHSLSGTQTLRLQTRLKGSTETSTSSSSTSVYRQRRPSLWLKVLVCALVIFPSFHFCARFAHQLQGYTVSRAILSDAIALTRGDRYFTHDFTPFNLTAWGFADCQRDPNAFGFGSTLGRLLLRTLPNDYTENSVYTFFPLMTPESMKTNLTKLNLLDKYDLSRPQTRTPLRIVSDHSEVVKLLNDKESTSKPYAARVARVIKGKGYGSIFHSVTKMLIVKADFSLRRVVRSKKRSPLP